MSLRYRLGLDLGASSVGWAVIELSHGKEPKATRLVATGVRIFEAGVEGSIEQGKDSSRGAERRMARLPRRQHWRSQHRKRSLFLWLQKLGLLPQTFEFELDEKGNPRGPLAEQRNQELEALDRQLIDKFVKGNLAASNCDGFVEFQILPYILRAKAAAGERLEPYELGRALYHLVQRRGYKSNRKASRNDEEEGVVFNGIQELDSARGGRTLAQYVVDSFRHRNGRFGFESEFGEFGTDNPHDKSTQIVRRYTHREMYRDEFDRIRTAQSALHPQLKPADWDRIGRILFYQRPMKSQSHLIGRCSLETERRRCTIAIPVFQEFRLLQQLNHLQVRIPGLPNRFLTSTEHARLLEDLSQQGEMALSKAVKLLRLPRGASFTQDGFGDDDDQKLIGHRTNAKLAPCFGDRWSQFSDLEREQITLEVLHYRDPLKLKLRAHSVWGLEPGDAEKLAKVDLEEGYGNLSRRAIQKLLPGMRQGQPYATVRKEVYPESFETGLEHDALPPVNSWNRDIRNPAVIRALTEMRKVVNEVLAKYGCKPDCIHIELTRDLRNSRDRRKTIWKNNEDQRKRRDKAKIKILNDLGINASRSDIEKWLLAEECQWVCPYTGNIISPTTLLGPHPQFDVEHIFPRRYLDDSFTNKTLCHVDFNRNRKKDRLPVECLNQEEYEQVLQRVRTFQSTHAESKLQRFETHTVPDDFTSRQLNDTRYNTRLAAQYLGTLYGGRADVDGVQRLVTPTGMLTWLMRRAWHLGKVLSDRDEKDREDHRHHAIDAIIVALTTQGEIQQIANAAATKSRPGERFNMFLDAIETPWNDFEDEVRREINRMQVSHRPTRSLAGPLHAETNYSKPYVTGVGKQQVQTFRIRRSLDRLTEREIQGDQIIDPHVRMAVQQKYAELCDKAVNKSDRTAAKFWSDRQNFPNFPLLRKQDGTGTGSPIFKVRMLTDTKARAIGKGARERQIASGKNSNYASLVYEILDQNGQVKSWKHEIVTRLDGHLNLNQHRKGKAERVLIPKTTEAVQVAWKLKPDESIRFLFSLRRNDMLLAAGPDSEDVLYRVQSLSDSEIQLCEHNRATVSGTDRNTWNRVTSIDALRKRKARCVAISPMGEIRELYLDRI
jgi:CRISPR-associated endonuclease Csn1